MSSFKSVPTRDKYPRIFPPELKELLFARCNFLEANKKITQVHPSRGDETIKIFTISTYPRCYTYNSSTLSYRYVIIRAE